LRLTPEAVSPPVDPAASTHPRRVLDALATYIVDDILADRAARAPTFGLDNPLAPRFWAAVKTGTSKDMRDNWCVGFTSRYTVGVWVGNFDGGPMWDVSGVSGAAPLWLETVSALHRGLPSSPPADPDGVVRTLITFEAGLEPAREELFLPGTELAHVAPKGGGAQLAAIAYPADGQIIAIDPDIPAPAQRIEFRTDRPAPGTTWRLNGEPLPEPPYWRPLPGRWHLGLHDATGRLLHEVWFEVRGSALPPASPAPPHAAAAGSGHIPQPLETRP
jgi:penicillin-binding protein 1C